MAKNSNHETELAARRVRDQKARDLLEDSYVRKLIRREFPASEYDKDFSIEISTLIEAKRLVLFARRVVSGKIGPEMDAIRKSFEKKYRLDPKFRKQPKG